MKYIKELRLFAKEQGYFRTLVFFVLFGILFFAIPAFLAGSKINISNSTSQTTKIEVPAGVKSEIKGSEDNLVYKNFDDNLLEWEIPLSSMNDGYYCPNVFSSFLAPEIWYEEQIPVSFKSLTFKYMLKNGNSKNNPSFIFSLGKSEQRFFRVYLPQKNPQSIGFEYYHSDDAVLSSEFLKGEALRDPIMQNSTIDFTIRSQIKKENTLTYIINVKYLSSVTETPIEDTFSYDVNYYDPDPANALLDFGISTYRGNCIKLLRYKIEK